MTSMAATMYIFGRMEYSPGGQNYPTSRGEEIRSTVFSLSASGARTSGSN
jgi:hypothetical protein